MTTTNSALFATENATTTLMKTTRTLLAFCLLLQPLSAQARTVKATVYDSWFHGRIAYCGQTYQHWGVSAAHPWLPCGTKVRVSHKGRSLVVPITDRCACNSIDLSAGAAHRLGVPLDGIASVQISY
jgi:rare lipoprotein A (peptidoglycan hydrolase)